jgi:hypothetical protein
MPLLGLLLISILLRLDVYVQLSLLLVAQLRALVFPMAWGPTVKAVGFPHAVGPCCIGARAERMLCNLCDRGLVSFSRYIDSPSQGKIPWLSSTATYGSLPCRGLLAHVSCGALCFAVFN